MSVDDITRYIEENKDKYPIESLRTVLLEAGHNPHDVDRAIRGKKGVWIERIKNFVIGAVLGAIVVFIEWMLFWLFIDVFNEQLSYGEGKQAVYVVAIFPLLNVILSAMVFKKFRKWFWGFLLTSILPALLFLALLIFLMFFFTVGW
ncbi:MAG: hypothetical protein GY861_04110 [bacterium]|nr:hypothetical protein [bacterium]